MSNQTLPKQREISMDKFTPGPWFDDGYRIYGYTDATDKRSGKLIVEYKHVWEFNHADARLISAAPELLEAVRTAYLCLTNPIATQITREQLIEKYRAALAKATGA